MDKTIFFLILNYNTFQETENCIRTIREMDEVPYKKHIVVVDNASTDDLDKKAELLKAEDVTVLCMESNKGFSRGNNAGYEYIRQIRRRGGVIIVCNSDIEFRDRRFLALVLDEYENTGFDILSPDVWCEAQKTKSWKGHQSPAFPWEGNKSYVKYQIRKNLRERERLLNNGYNGLNVVYTFLDRLISLKYAILIRLIYRKWRLRYHENIVAHGSCFVVSDNFIMHEEKLFFPETEFYFEELLLNLRVKDKGYKTVYKPEIQVWHMQGQATKRVAENEQERRLFAVDHLIKSGMIYLNELNRKGSGGSEDGIR